MIDESKILETKTKIDQASHIMVVSHVRPDGDAIGSLLGLGLSLEQIGKKVQMVLVDGIPEGFTFLAGWEKIITNPQFPVDLTIVVDSSEIDRVGDVFKPFEVPDVNIDHHITNRDFAAVNLVDSDAAATAEILTELLPRLGLPQTPEVDNALLTGILTDTIGFRTGSVSPKTLHIAAGLMERGANLTYLYKKALASRSMEALRYWGLGLENVNLENRLVWTSLSLKDREKSGYKGRDDADLINILSAMREIDIAVIFVEQANGVVKISWRAQNGFDVSSVAEAFDGGGHRAASGAEVKGTLGEVTDRVITETRKVLTMNINLA